MAAADPELDEVWALLEDFSDTARLASARGFPTLESREIALVPRADAPERDLEDSSEGLSGNEAATLPAKKPISNVVDKEEVPASRFLLPPECPASVTRLQVQGCDAFVLDGVLSAEECQSLVEQADGLWSFWDSSGEQRKSFRDAHTVEVTHRDLADRMWGRVQHLVEPLVSISDGDPHHEVDIEGTWHACGINPNMLLGRYLDGGHFSPHTDGTTVVDFNCRTFYSCVLFLNESPWGGGTRIYSDEQMQKPLVPDENSRLTGDPSLVLAEVAPRAGRMLVFYHRLMHEGVPAKEKFILRTDVLYHREPEQCTAPEDIRAFEMYQEAQLQAEHGNCQEAADLFRRAFKTSPALAAVYKM